MQKQYRHLFDRYYPFGGITLVYWYSPQDPYKVNYQYAICSDRDHYSRKIGIEVATSGKTYGFKSYEDRELCSTILEDILTNHDLPTKNLREVHNRLRSSIFKRYILEEGRVKNLLTARIGEDDNE